MKRQRPLWPIDEASYADVLTGQSRADHTCTPFLRALEEAAGRLPHDVQDCPGPLTLEELAGASWDLDRAE